jgi:hypothetical protein
MGNSPSPFCFWREPSSVTVRTLEILEVRTLEVVQLMEEESSPISTASMSSKVSPLANAA